jgi:hypothetical protein
VPKSPPSANDRQRLDRAFRSLRKRDVIALANIRGTRSDGWTAVAEQSTDDDTCVFWTSEAAVEAFSEGRLTRRLCLQWRGDAIPIVNALRAEGLRAALPGLPKETIDVRGAAGKPQPLLAEKPTAKKNAQTKSAALSPALAAVQAALDTLAAKGWRILFKPSMTLAEANSLKPRTLGLSIRSLLSLKPKENLLTIEFGGDPKVAMAAFRKQRVSIALESRRGGAFLWIDLDKTATRVAPRSQ